MLSISLFRGLVVLQTKEEIKRAIRDYLVNLPSKTKQVEEYTMSKISDVVKAEISNVEEAIEELEGEKLVDSRKVELKVYVPKTREGSQVLTTFARKEYITYSPYWAVFFGFALLFIGLLIGERNLTLPAQAETSFEAYLIGIRHGLGGSFAVGLLGGLVIQNILSKFRCWQIVSEEIYETISRLVKYSAYLFVPLVIGYYVVANQLGYQFELSIIFVLLGISVASAFSYERISRKGSS